MKRKGKASGLGPLPREVDSAKAWGRLGTAGQRRSGEALSGGGEFMKNSVGNAPREGFSGLSDTFMRPGTF